MKKDRKRKRLIRVHGYESLKQLREKSRHNETICWYCGLDLCDYAEQEQERLIMEAKPKLIPKNIKDLDVWAKFGDITDETFKEELEKPKKIIKYTKVRKKQLSKLHKRGWFTVENYSGFFDGGVFWA